MKRTIKEPFSSISHMVGFLAAIPILIILVMRSKDALSMIAFIIFGAALMLLYGASSTYHAVIAREKITNILQRLDHMMIFVLIAGTYTPICLISLRGVVGYTLLISVWICAVLGIIFKIFWMNAPVWISTAIYVFMGWIAVFASFPILKTFSLNGIVLIVAGGIAYTVGAVIFALERPKLPFKYFGSHELFHLFVLAGSIFHVAFMFVCAV